MISLNRGYERDNWVDVRAGNELVEISSDPYTYSSNSIGYSKHYRSTYARVIDLDDLTVGKAESLMGQTSYVDDNSFQNAYQLSTSAILDPLMNAGSQASSNGSFHFSASYRIHEPAQFNLRGSIAGSESLSGTFNFSKRNSSQSIYQTSLDELISPEGSLSFALEGILEPGIYDFDFEADSSVTISPLAALDAFGLASTNEMGEFIFDFEASTLSELQYPLADLNHDDSVDHQDLLAWESSLTQPDAQADINQDSNIDGSDFLKMQTALEPSQAASGLIRNWGEQYQATHEKLLGLEPGQSFLNWQRSFGRLQGSAASLAAVPEMNSLLTLLSGFIASVAVRRRSR
ncbi:MAG: hypothetical protein RID07_05270 [Lacipirellulaceae bacterium]